MSMIRAHGRRVAVGNVDDEATDEHSWTEIGRALGITRQSARERFGS